MNISLEEPISLKGTFGNSFLNFVVAQPMIGTETSRTGNQEMFLAEVKSNS